METDNQKNTIVDKWTNYFVLDEITYYCNEVNPHPVHRMGGFIMDFGREEYISSDDESSIILLPRNCKQSTPVFALHTLNKYIRPESDERIVIGLFRKGESTPLYYREHELLYDDTIYIDMETDIVAGEYIFAVGNIAPYDHLQKRFEKVDNFYVSTIKVIEHGEHLLHPVLLSADIDSDWSMTLKFDDEMDISTAQLRCECYDEDFRLVGETEHLLALGNHRNELSLKLRKTGWWTDGNFHLIVYHNQEPFAHVRYSTHDENHIIDFTPNLSHNSIFYKLCRDLKSSGKKFMFCMLNGCGKLKKKVLDFLCESHVHVNEHLMFAASGKPEYEVMFTVTGILHPHYGYQTFKVPDLMKEVSIATDPLETLDVMLARRSTVIYELDNLTDVCNEAFAKLLLKVAAARHGFIILYGTPNELKRVLDMYPEWNNYLLEPTYWNVYDYAERDAFRTVEQIFKNKNLTANWATCEKLQNVIHENWDSVQSWRKSDYERWIETEVMLRIKQRVFSENSFSQTFLQTVLEDDVTLTIRKEYTPESFGYSLVHLEHMVGLKDVKDHLKLLFKRMDFDRKREMLGLRKLQSGIPHMVFTGNPGTGKTTVAKLVGQAFKQLGYLSKGEVIAVERSQMVGQYIGETERRMTEMLKKAKGNVLFIDEAYSLSDNTHGDRKDFGCRVLECLLPILADANSDIIVILAGYEKEMKQMMELNPGMKGRFPFWFRFEDYDADELYEIAIGLLEVNDYMLTDGAKRKLKECIGEALKVKDRFFHNARWVNQLVQDGALAMMAERLYEIEPAEYNRSLFSTVTEDDITKGYEIVRTDNKVKSERKVGFR